MLHKDAILQINFGYTQLLFMGSVPRITTLIKLRWINHQGVLATVLW
jgi:hypothetical protein